MKRFGHIDLGKHFGPFDVVTEVVEVWEGVGGLEGDLVEFPEVATRAFRAIRLALEVEPGTPVVRLVGSDFLNYSHLYHFHPCFITFDSLWRPRKKRSGLTADRRRIPGGDLMDYIVFDVLEVRRKYIRELF